MKIILFLHFLFFSVSTFAQQETVWEYVDKKLEKKEFKRWSLSSWFYDKQKFAFQDQWLAMNTDDGFMFEFFADYSAMDLTLDSNTTTIDGKAGEAAAYLGFLGISGRFESYTDNYSFKEGSLNLRLIGSSHQSTHLILTYGKRVFETASSVSKYDQSFYGADISLYLVSILGFDGRYRKYAKNEDEIGATEMESTRSQWGVFIDIWAIRIFAYQFLERFETTTIASGALTKTRAEGSALGLRFYF